MAEPFDVPALWAALDAARRAQGTSWAAIGRATGVSPSTLRRTEHADDLEADGMLQMVAWLGVEPEAFTSGSAPDPPGALERTGNGIDRADTAALFAAIDERRAIEGLTWAATAAAMASERATTDALRGLQRGGRVSTQVLLSATRWLGAPVRSFVRRSPV